MIYLSTYFSVGPTGPARSSGHEITNQRRCPSPHTLHPHTSDSILPLTTDQLRARPSRGLCGEGFLLLHAADLDSSHAGNTGSTATAAIACQGCGAALGTRVAGQRQEPEPQEAATATTTTAEQDPNNDDDGVRLWGHALGVLVAAAPTTPITTTGLLQYVPLLERHYSLATHLALALRGATRRLKKRR